MPLLCKHVFDFLTGALSLRGKDDGRLPEKVRWLLYSSWPVEVRCWLAGWLADWLPACLPACLTD
jgi:hypothetical protein